MGRRSYKYYDLIMAAFVCVLLCSNFIGAAKQATVTLPLIGPVTFGAGVLFFPISYFFGDILTEVYGYGRDRRVIWAGFGALAFASASMLAYWCGSFANSFVLAKMKVLTGGKWLWTRTIGSTAVGELVDSALFYTIAFQGIWTSQDIVTVIVTQYLVKTTWEILATPLTYRIVGALKRVEHEDWYDRHTNFNPFRIKD
jgi:queuosine precursor transporter